MELILAFALVLAASLGGFLVLRRAGLSRSGNWLFRMVPVAAVALFLTGVASLYRPSIPEHEIQDRPIEVQPEGYVTSRSCQACHPGAYDTWDASYHSSMTQVVSPETVLGDFDDVELRYGEWLFRLQREGDEFWVEMPDLDWSIKGPRAPLVRRKIVMSTGSHHVQAYWYTSGNTRVLGLMPFVWNIGLGRWVPRDATFLRPPEVGPESEIGRWNKICIECHVVLGRLRPVDPNGHDTHVAEFGIACELCHGPAADHAAANRNPLRRYSSHFSEKRDPDIVQPEHLPHDRGSEVCGQCHSQTIWTSQETIDEWMEQGFTYRPGEVLVETRSFVLGKYEQNSEEVKRVLDFQLEFMDNTFWRDGKTRVASREYTDIVKNPCFQRGEMSCFSCHEMHKDEDDPRSLKEWANDQLKPGMRGDLACTQCHEEYLDPARLVPHTHHEKGSSGSMCYNCHMPHNQYGALNGIRHHEIGNPSARVTAEVGRPNACNLCHLDKTLAWTAKWLESWYDISAPPLFQVEHEVASSVLLSLRGDAGQRALSAWSLGWKPALEVSGDDWEGFFLAALLGDPYPAVRHIAYGSLRKLPGFEDYGYDYMASVRQLYNAGNVTFLTWQRQHAENGGRRGPAILIDSDGKPQMERLLELRAQRDDRLVRFAE